MTYSVQLGATNSLVFPPLLLMTSTFPSPVKSPPTTALHRSPSWTVCFFHRSPARRLVEANRTITPAAAQKRRMAADLCRRQSHITSHNSATECVGMEGVEATEATLTVATSISVCQPVQLSCARPNVAASACATLSCLRSIAIGHRSWIRTPQSQTVVTHRLLRWSECDPASGS